jgi:hypothetical protein
MEAHSVHHITPGSNSTQTLLVGNDEHDITHLSAYEIASWCLRHDVTVIRVSVPGFGFNVGVYDLNSFLDNL